MTHRVRHVVAILVIAITAALLLAALPGSVATAATGPKACKVHNATQKIGRNTLQRAVWAANAGDTLIVRGTCVGTTIIKKDLTIGWVELPRSGTPTLRSNSKLPTLVVDSGVTGLEIKPGLRVQGTVVVDDVRAWKRSVAAASGSVTPASVRKERACSIRNRRSGDRFGRMQRAVVAASPADSLVFTGKCWGGTTIDKSLTIRGLRIQASSIECGPKKCSKPTVTDTGVPVITDVTVESGVEGVTLTRLALPKGFAVE